MLMYVDICVSLLFGDRLHSLHKNKKNGVNPHKSNLINLDKH